MFDNILIEDLARAPATTWPRLIGRAPTLRRLCEWETPSAAQIKEACAELAVGRRQLFALIAEFRIRLAGVPASGPQTGVNCRIDEKQERAIRDAKRNLRPTARQCEIYREAKRLSIERGISPPGDTAIRRRFDRGVGPIDLSRDLRQDCGLVIDQCALDLNVITADGGAAPAHLLVFVDPRTSCAIDHELYAGCPTPTQLTDAVARIVLARAEGNPRVRLIAPATLAETISLAGLPAHFIKPVSRPRVVGFAISAIYGRRIGRIQIRSQTRHWGREVQSDPIALDVCVQVVRYLIEERNRQLL